MSHNNRLNMVRVSIFINKMFVCLFGRTQLNKEKQIKLSLMITTHFAWTQPGPMPHSEPGGIGQQLSNVTRDFGIGNSYYNKVKK